MLKMDMSVTSMARLEKPARTPIAACVPLLMEQSEKSNELLPVITMTEERDVQAGLPLDDKTHDSNSHMLDADNVTVKPSKFHAGSCCEESVQFRTIQELEPLIVAFLALIAHAFDCPPVSVARSISHVLLSCTLMMSSWS